METMEFDNGLTKAEAERLAILAEECGEVIQVIGKILRHGYHGVSSIREKERQWDNRQNLEIELGDVQFAMWLMQSRGDVDSGKIVRRSLDKGVLAEPYLHHQQPATTPDKS